MVTRKGNNVTSTTSILFKRRKYGLKSSGTWRCFKWLPTFRKIVDPKYVFEGRTVQDELTKAQIIRKLENLSHDTVIHTLEDLGRQLIAVRTSNSAPPPQKKRCDVFRISAPCRIISSIRHFGGTYRLHLQGDSIRVTGMLKWPWGENGTVAKQNYEKGRT